MEKHCYGCMRIKMNSPVCEHCGYDERATNAPHQLPAGTLLRNKYLVGRVLGQGGFGITYLGLDCTLNIPIAIKEYYPSTVVLRDSRDATTVVPISQEHALLFQENRNRFLREAQTLAQLQDIPEVVQVMNFFEEHGTAYIVMGYVKGITLAEYTRRKGGTLSTQETLRLLQPLLEAMGQVHNTGLVHRDISPDNIMISPGGRVRLIDFGAAHEASTSDGKSTQAVLKHGFAPPEQYQRKGKLGPWTDVYALCATIYTCLTGLQPPAMTDRVMGEEDFEWDRITDLARPQLEALRQGLILDYRQRLQSTSALCQALFGIDDFLLFPEFAPTVPNIAQVASPAAYQQPVYTAPVYRQPENVYTVPPAPRPVYTTPVSAAQPMATVPLNSGSRVLMEYSINNKAFRTGIHRNMIKTITFLNTTSTAPVNAVDASLEEDRSVLAWVSSCGNLYDLYLAADGYIFAPANSSFLFAYMDQLTRICFDGNLDTSGVKSMRSMFWGCSKLVHMDIGHFNTRNVTDMAFMFLDCNKLTDLDVSHFDTENVSDMAYMFTNTKKIRSIYGNFKVSQVTSHMGFMDKGCFFNGRPWEELFK